MIDRAGFNLGQSVETIVDGCFTEGPAEIAVSDDEFRLDVRLSRSGPLASARIYLAEIGRPGPLGLGPPVGAVAASDTLTWPR